MVVAKRGLSIGLLFLLAVAVKPDASQAANYKGLSVVIDPYDTTGAICRQSGTGLQWLSNATCPSPNGTTPNYVISLLSSGAVSGVFFRIQWSDFYADRANKTNPLYPNGYPTLQTAFGYLATIAQHSGKKFNVTVGLGAGVSTPCDIYSQNQNLGPTFVPNPTPNGGASCNAIPTLWIGQNLPGYANDVIDLFNQSQTFLGTSGSVVAVKMSGVNTGTQELYITGSPHPLTATPNEVCGTTPQTCGSQADAADDELSAGYSPIGVEGAWNSIAASLSSLLKTNPNLMFEADVTGGNAFPPLTEGQTPSPNGTPDFVCTTDCVLDQGRSVGPFGQAAFTADGYIFSQQLLGDLKAQGIPTGSMAVQTDGMQDQNGNVSPQDTANLPLNLPCWAYKNLGQTPTRTQMGFQSVGPELYDNNSFTQSNYEAGLTNAVHYGAKYEELYPYHLQSYVALQSVGLMTAETFLSGVQTTLVSDNPGAAPDNGCSGDGRTQ